MRAWLAMLVGAVVLFGSVTTASAKPPDPAACTFELGFAAIHETIGEEIVGECVSNQTFDRFGNATQESTYGTLFWLARRNQVSFHDGSQLWINGPRGEGLRSRLTVGGLGERESRNDPVSAPVVEVFEYAALTPGDVGDGWTYGEVPRTVPAELDLVCYPNRPDPTFGSTYVWFLNEATGGSFVQSLTALPSDEAALMRTRLEAEAAACDGWTEHSRIGTVRIHLRVEPFLELGDDSALVEFAIENVDTGERRVGQSAYVRYSGLVSTLALLAPMEMRATRLSRSLADSPGSPTNRCARRPGTYATEPGNTAETSPRPPLRAGEGRRGAAPRISSCGRHRSRCSRRAAAGGEVLSPSGTTRQHPPGAR